MNRRRLGVALVAIAAKERGELRLRAGLQDQMRPEPGHVLLYLGRRYSLCHFQKGVVVSAGDAYWTPAFAIVEASSMTATSLTRSFKRSAVAVFVLGNHTWVAPTGTYGPPSLISIEGPGGTGTVNFQPLRYLSPVPVPVWENSNWKANVWAHYMVGEPPGVYRFKIEHYTGAQVMAYAGVASALMASTVPYVLLAGADADVPACSVFRTRTKLASGTILCS
ncbi:MAG: hypothetical protein WDA27_08870 [Actinomycetota bacterium]